jgi:hypothetical protein
MRALIAGMLVAGSVALIGQGTASAALVTGALDDYDMRPTEPIMQQAYCGEDCREWHHQRHEGWDHRRHRYWRDYDRGRFWR